MPGRFYSQRPTLYGRIQMPREWNTPHREKWNAPIHNILKAIDNHTMLWFETGDEWHLQQQELLRKYVKDLKVWIHKQEGCWDE